MQAFRTPFMVVASLILFFRSGRFLSYYLLNPYLIPPPTQVFATAIPMIKSGEIFRPCRHQPAARAHRLFARLGLVQSSSA